MLINIYKSHLEFTDLDPLSFNIKIPFFKNIPNLYILLQEFPSPYVEEVLNMLRKYVIT